MENLHRIITKVVVEDGCIGFPERGYMIDLERVKTPAEILHWVNHLIRKNWMNIHLIKIFIEKACQCNGMDIFDVASLSASQGPRH